jgi:hypothetical protein
MLAPRLHPIFACVVLAEDLADLPGKALVGFSVGVVALFITLARPSQHFAPRSVSDETGCDGR